MRLIFTAMALSFSAVAHGAWNTSQPPARSVAEAMNGFESRAQQVVENAAEATIPPYAKATALRFYNAVLAKLMTGRDVVEVNRAILAPSAKPYGVAGTDFKFIPYLCERKGDYDFMLIGLLHTAYRFKDKPELLWPESYEKMLTSLFTVRGNRPRTSFVIGICGTHPETENHILMTEVSRYLTNQLLFERALSKGEDPAPWDNAANGMEAWMLQHLQGFLKEDFSEYNSKPYQNYAVIPLETLHSFAQSPRVKEGARLLLDYLSARYATQSLDLRRAGPFRRQKKYRGVDNILDGEGQIGRYAVLTGAYGLFYNAETSRYEINRGGHVALLTASAAYRMAPAILDLFFARGDGLLQRVNGQAYESYYLSDSFMLVAGGIYKNYKDYGTAENDGWAEATALVPAGQALLRSSFIRFQGHQNMMKRNNSCVARGFACGANPIVPPGIPRQCVERRLDREGAWDFFDFAKEGCRAASSTGSYYVALYRAPCRDDVCRDGGSTFGFMEAREASKAGMGFGSFRDAVLQRNGGRVYYGGTGNQYVTTEGEAVRFVPVPSSRSMAAIDGAEVRGLARGDVINGARDGLVRIDNKNLGVSYFLDWRQWDQPRRWTQAYAEGQSR
jgi:hypothetical protein